MRPKIVVFTLLACCLLMIPRPAQSIDLPQLSVEEIVTKLNAREAWRENLMSNYSVVLKMKAEAKRFNHVSQLGVLAEFNGNGEVKFQDLYQSGSDTVRRRVFNAILNKEIEKANDRFLQRENKASICWKNYSFKLIETGYLDSRPCYVLEVEAKRHDHSLFNGRIWVDAEDFDIIQMSGQTAARLSLLVSPMKFLRTYRKVGELWLPTKHQAEASIFLIGETSITIDYNDYQISENGQHSSQH